MLDLRSLLFWLELLTCWTWTIAGAWRIPGVRPKDGRQFYGAGVFGHTKVLRSFTMHFKYLAYVPKINNLLNF
jgi:hypothetical protein